MTEELLTEIARQLNSADNIGVVCHIRPDGDALGSAAALVTALQNAGKNAWLLCEEPAPQRLQFLPALQGVSTALPPSPVDLFVSCDCADISRLGVFGPAYARFKGPTINIDHHISNTRYAKINCVCECPATCQILPDVLAAANLPITGEIADLLAMGLLTDSGNFAHQDVTGRTFRVAAELRERGADFNRLNYMLFDRQEKRRALLFARVLASMRFCLEDRLAFLTVTQADFAATDTDKSLTEGFVDYPLTIDGVEVSVAVMEVKRGQYKISLRSKRADVNAVASSFGGGGHVLASGCMLFGEYEEVIDRLTYAVSQQL